MENNDNVIVERVDRNTLQSRNATGIITMINISWLADHCMVGIMHNKMFLYISNALVVVIIRGIAISAAEWGRRETRLRSVQLRATSAHILQAVQTVYRPRLQSQGYNVPRDGPKIPEPKARGFYLF